jgi:hypothetical protein
MRGIATPPALLMAIFVAGCGKSAAPPAPAGPVQLRAVYVRDFSGFWGGRFMWAVRDQPAVIQVAGNPPVGAWGQDPGPQLWERRYHRRLTADDWEKAERLVGTHNFFKLESPKQFGPPDSAIWEVVVVTQDGVRAKVSGWSGDNNPDFAAVFRHLQRLSREADEKPFYEGRYNPKWRPDWFDPD